MTNEHNLEENEGAHAPHSPHSVGHCEWEEEGLCWRKLQEEYPRKRPASAVTRRQKEGFKKR